MIWRAVVAAVCTSVSVGQLQPGGEPTRSLEGIVLRLTRATKSQREGLGEYSVKRRYSVRWKNRKDVDVLEVLWTYRPDAGKTLQVIKSEGSSRFTQEALREVVETEEKNSHLKPDPASITPDHYSFELESENADAYKLRITPQQASKFLVHGYILTDKKSGAIMRVEGKTSKRLSFWVGNADLVREYAKTGEFWLPLRTRSSAHVRFVGDAELTINSENYVFAKR